MVREYYNAYYVLGENKLNLEKEKFKLINFLQLNIGTDEIILEPYNNWGDETFLFDENKMDIYIKNYPSIKYEQNKLEALRTNTNILKNNLKPKIYGSYSIGTNYFGSLNNLLKSESLTLQWQNNIINKIGVGISIPILNKYSDKSLIIQSKINENIQSNNISNLVNNLSLQIKDIYINYKNNKNLLEIEKNRISISNEVNNMSVKAFDAGTLNIYDVNKSRLDNFTHNVNYTKLEFQNALYKEVLNIYLKKIK